MGGKTKLYQKQTHCPCALITDVKVTVPGHGEVVVDISYGGAFYAFVSAERFGLDVNTSRTRDLVDAATAVTNAVKSQATGDWLNINNY